MSIDMMNQLSILEREDEGVFVGEQTLSSSSTTTTRKSKRTNTSSTANRATMTLQNIGRKLLWAVVCFLVLLVPSSEAITNAPSPYIFPSYSCKSDFSGDYQHCVLFTDGSMKCWGRNNNGQLGYGDITDRGDGIREMGDSLPFVDLSGSIASISTGLYHVCAVLMDFSTKCWGKSTQGQLGQGDTNNRGDGAGEMGSYLTVIDLGSNVLVSFIVSGNYHNCMQSLEGQVKCWGQNTKGQLGYGDTNSRGDGVGEMGSNLPFVDLGTSCTVVTDLSTGSNHACVICSNGSMMCWGYNNNGQLGYGDTVTRGDGAGEMGDYLPFVDVEGTSGLTVSSIFFGGSHTCVIFNDSSMKCWGGNTNGQLGYGDINDRGDGSGEMGDYLPFVDVGTGRTVLSGCGGFTHICVILDDYSLKCWGSNTNGELGYGDTNNRGDGAGEMGDYLPTVDVGTGLTAESVHCGRYYTCAVLNNGGSMKCWGDNTYGQLGQGSTDNLGDGSGEMGDYLPAIDLGSGLHIEACFDLSPTVSPTMDPTIAPTFDPTFDPTITFDPTFSPSTYTYPSYSCKSDFGGYQRTCAIFTDQTMKCWGYNVHGELGYGDTTTRGDGANEMGSNLPFVDVSGSVASISTGSYHSCVILSDFNLKCWGLSNNGELGQGDTNDRGDGAGEMGSYLPVIDVGSNVLPSFIVSGGFHNCIVSLEGQVKCWGANWSGQLGYGDTNKRGDGASEMGGFFRVDRTHVREMASSSDTPVLTLILIPDGKTKAMSTLSSALGHL